MPTPPPNRRPPRVLIPVTINFTLRYVLLTGLVDQLAGDAEVVLGLTWDAPALVEQLRADGREAVVLPHEDPGPEVARLQALAKADLQRRLASPTTRIDHRLVHLEQPWPVRTRRLLQAERLRWSRRLPGAPPAGRAELAAALDRAGVLQPARRAIEDLRIDAVVSVTPFVSQEAAILHAAAERGLPRIASYLSFDNPTTRPPLPVEFDRYLVWNRWNREEVLRGDPTIAPDQVVLTGPPQFDLYRDPMNVAPRDEWAAGLDLDPRAPTVLFGAGPPGIAPHEPQHLDHLIAAIGQTLPSDLVVVLRRHPHDRPGRWDRFLDHPAVRADDPGPVNLGRRPGEAAFGRAEVVGLCSSLAHTDVHLSTSSTMTLDGAWYDKPQIGPAYDVEGSRRHRRHAADLYRREHYVPIVASGGIELVRSPAALVAAVADALANPARRATEREAMLTSLCTWTDGRSTPRVAAQIRDLLAADRVAPPPAGGAP